MSKFRWIAALAVVCMTCSGVMAGGSDVVAKIGDWTVTFDELDQATRAANADVYQKLYEARLAVLEQMVGERMVEREATSREMTSEEFLETEFTARRTTVDDAEIEKFFNENQARMGGQTLEEMSPRIRQFLELQGNQAAADSLMAELRKKYGARITLPAPRMEVTVSDAEPSKGPATAPITIVEYSEFQCPFCSRVGPAIEQVLATYGDKVRLVFRDFPLPFHENAHAAAQASHCAHDQGKFWEYHDVLFQNQSALGAEQLKSYATQVGLDGGAFAECLDSGRFASAVDANHAEGQRLGVTGTPAFFINGRFLNGAQPYEAFAKIIDDELAMAEADATPQATKSKKSKKSKKG